VFARCIRPESTGTTGVNTASGFRDSNSASSRLCASSFWSNIVGSRPRIWIDGLNARTTSRVFSALGSVFTVSGSTCSTISAAAASRSQARASASSSEGVSTTPMSNRLATLL
jgi:hypothetical protein